MLAASYRSILFALCLLSLIACGSTKTTAPPTLTPAEKVGSPNAESNPTTAPNTSLGSDFTPGHFSASESWVRDRVQAVIGLYNISDDGRDVLLRLDVRQMRGQPGFFGSYGYSSWTGVGEAKPSTIMHELGHAYWGAFPVTGLGELSWEVQEGEALSPAMERYHRDVLEFMRQPPGHYELFRSRLHNIPGLSETNLDPLSHTVEADTVDAVGGDLELLPPILRKYWDRFLQPGPWHSWYEAAAWFANLTNSETPLAQQYTGFEHLDLRQYGSLRPSESIPITQQVVETLDREERQRLWDFADQFDLLLGAPEYEENFGFWRGYLRDMQQLHRRHAGFLESIQPPRSREISEAFDFLRDLDGESLDNQAEAIKQIIQVQPFVLHFLPVLDNRTLLALFAMDSLRTEGTTLKGTKAFVERLSKFTPTVDEVIRLGQQSPASAVSELSAFLETQDFENKQDLEFFFQLLRDADHATAQETVSALDDATIRRLVRTVPATTRSLLDAQTLLKALGIAASATPEHLALGIDMLTTYSSGNFLIDEPFVDELYSVVATRSEADITGTLDALSSSPFPWERFILGYPREAVSLLASDLDAAAALVMQSDSVIFPAARFVYRLIAANPEFAARLVGRLDDRSEDGLVVESLAHYAYDAGRLASVPGLPISLENDGLFLVQLMEDKGPTWLRAQILDVIRVYAGHIERGDVPEDFLDSYKSTLEAGVAALPEGQSRQELHEMLQELFPQ